MKPRILAPLASTPFVVALALLLTNDLVLKAAYGNWLTGKLSDFAGLYALGFFCAVLWPQRRLAPAIALAFALWKSPFASPVIDWIGRFAPLGRTVDYSDLMALPAIWAGCAQAATARPWRAPRGVPACLALLGIVAFTATSVVPGNLRQTLTLERVAGITADEQVSALTRGLDAFARRHGLACMVCGDITHGLVYDNGRDLQLTATFDAPTQQLFVGASSTQRSSKAQARTRRLLEELHAQLQENPAATAVREVSTYDRDSMRAAGVTVELDLGAPAPQPAAIEAARRVVSQIIGDLAQRHALETAGTSFVLGRRFGPRDGDREFQLWVSYANVPLVRVSSVRLTAEHEALQRELLAELESRLRSAFPTARLTTTR